MKNQACLTQLILRNSPRQLDFALSDIAVTASAQGVGVIVGHRLFFDARIEAKHAGGVGPHRLFSPCHRLVVVGDGVFATSHLHHVAPASPAIGRIVLLPKRAFFWLIGDFFGQNFCFIEISAILVARIDLNPIVVVSSNAGQAYFFLYRWYIVSLLFRRTSILPPIKTLKKVANPNGACNLLISCIKTKS